VLDLPSTFRAIGNDPSYAVFVFFLFIVPFFFLIFVLVFLVRVFVVVSFLIAVIVVLCRQLLLLSGKYP
jgi:hypothetical protein